MKYRARRKPTVFNVRLLTETGERNASVVDVTSMGARVQLETGNLIPETNVSIPVRSRKHKATVVWARDGEAGLMFQRALTPDVLALLSRQLQRTLPGKRSRFLMN